MEAAQHEEAVADEVVVGLFLDFAGQDGGFAGVHEKRTSGFAGMDSGFCFIKDVIPYGGEHGAVKGCPPGQAFGAVGFYEDGL